jgi:hypothetical protein
MFASRNGLDKPIRILREPPVIDRKVIGNEIKNQIKLSEPLSQQWERLRTAECCVHWYRWMAYGPGVDFIEKGMGQASRSSASARAPRLGAQ